MLINTIRKAFKANDNQDLTNVAKPTGCALFHEITKTFYTLHSAIFDTQNGDEYEHQLIINNRQQIQAIISQVCKNLETTIANRYIDSLKFMGNLGVVVANKPVGSVIRLGSMHIRRPDTQHNHRQLKTLLGYKTIGSVFMFIDDRGDRYYLQRITFDKYVRLNPKAEVNPDEIQGMVLEGVSCTSLFDGYDSSIAQGYYVDNKNEFAIVIEDNKICISPFEDGSLFGRIISKDREILATWDSNDPQLNLQSLITRLRNAIGEVPELVVPQVVENIISTVDAKRVCTAILNILELQSITNVLQNFFYQFKSYKYYEWSNSRLLYTNRDKGYQLYQFGGAFRIYPLDFDPFDDRHNSELYTEIDYFCDVNVMNEFSKNPEQFIQKNILPKVRELKQLIFEAQEIQNIKKSIEQVKEVMDCQCNIFYTNVDAGYHLVQADSRILICNVAMDKNGNLIDGEAMLSVSLQIYEFYTKKAIVTFKSNIVKNKYDFIKIKILQNLEAFKRMFIRKLDSSATLYAILDTQAYIVGYKDATGTSFRPAPMYPILDGPHGATKRVTAVSGHLPLKTSLKPQVALTLRPSAVSTYLPLSKKIEKVLNENNLDCFIRQYQINENDIITEYLGEDDLANALISKQRTYFDVKHYRRVILQFEILQELDIFHFDIKPSNLFFVSAINSIVVIDNDGRSMHLLGIYNNVEYIAFTPTMFPWGDFIKGIEPNWSNNQLDSWPLDIMRVQLGKKNFAKKYLKYTILNSMIIDYNHITNGHKKKKCQYPKDGKFSTAIIEQFVIENVPQPHQEGLKNFLNNPTTYFPLNLSEVFEYHQ